MSSAALSARLVAFGALLAGCAGQAGEATDYDASVASLCDIAEGDVGQGPVVSYSLTVPANLQQTGGTTVQVPTVPGQPDAVWVKDEYGMILAYQANPNFPLTLEFGVDANDVKLFAHYPTCYIASSPNMLTWKKQYDDAVAGDAFFSSDSAAPVFETPIDYNSKTATVTFTQPAGTSVPYVVATDSAGVVHFFSTAFDAAPAQAASRQVSFTFPASATSLTACTLSCETLDLVAEIVSGFDSDGTQSLSVCVAASTCALPTQMSDTNVLRVGTSCASDYTLYAQPPGSTTVLAYGSNQALSIDVTGRETLVVKQKCGASAVQAMSVELAPLREAYQLALDSTSIAPVAGGSAAQPALCVVGGKTYGYLDVWSQDGESCTCVQGVAECGGGITRGIYLDAGTTAGVVVSTVVLAAVVGGLVYFYRMQKAAREAEHGRKKSISGKEYYGSSTANALPGQSEIELPAGGQSVGVETNPV